MVVSRKVLASLRLVAFPARFTFVLSASSAALVVPPCRWLLLIPQRLLEELELVERLLELPQLLELLKPQLEERPPNEPPARRANKSPDGQITISTKRTAVVAFIKLRFEVRIKGVWIPVIY